MTLLPTPPPPSTSRHPRATLDAYRACLQAGTLTTCPPTAELVRLWRSTSHMTIPRISSPFSSPGSGSRLLIVRSPPIHERRSINHTGGQNDAPQIRRATEKIKPTPNDQTPDTIATAPSITQVRKALDRSRSLSPPPLPRILNPPGGGPPMPVETGTITVKPACQQAGAAWPRPARLDAQGRRHHACPPPAETSSPREVLTDDD